MGYFISAHVFREKPDFSRLLALPNSIGYRGYFHRAANLYLLDTFRAPSVPEYPFQSVLPAVDIPLELASELDVLERLYSRLSRLKLANSFKKSYINGALLLNRLLELPVFSFVSDDDELDFTCSVANSSLSSLKCQCRDLVVSFDGKHLQIAPLVPEFAEGEEFLSDVESLRAALPEAEFLPRTTLWNIQLHAIASEQLQLFTGIQETILGVGSFDPPEDAAEWELVASR